MIEGRERQKRLNTHIEYFDGLSKNLSLLETQIDQVSRGSEEMVKQKSEMLSFVPGRTIDFNKKESKI